METEVTGGRMLVFKKGGVFSDGAPTISCKTCHARRIKRLLNCNDITNGHDDCGSPTVDKFSLIYNSLG